MARHLHYNGAPAARFDTDQMRRHECYRDRTIW